MPGVLHRPPTEIKIGSDLNPNYLIDLGVLQFCHNPVGSQISACPAATPNESQVSWPMGAKAPQTAPTL